MHEKREESTPPGGPSEELISNLISELGQTFDLSTSIGGSTLAEAVERRIRALSPGEPPEWGTAGDLKQVARVEAGPLDFYYRPHLLADMDPALRLGHLLQFDLLPRGLPKNSPLQIAAIFESYCHLSGDLLGWRLEGDELFLWIADVSGHGVQAGLAAAVLYFMVEALDPRQEPADLARSMNQSMLAAKKEHSMMFATAFWLRFRADGQGVYASSGHPPMLLRRASGDIEQLGATGRPIGLLPNETFDQVDFQLGAEDCLCLFTDGLIEAQDPAGEELGRQRLSDTLSYSSGLPLAITSAVYQTAQSHRSSKLLDDDFTFMIVAPSRD